MAKLSISAPDPEQAAQVGIEGLLPLSWTLWLTVTTATIVLVALTTAVGCGLCRHPIVPSPWSDLCPCFVPQVLFQQALESINTAEQARSSLLMATIDCTTNRFTETGSSRQCFLRSDVQAVVDGDKRAAARHFHCAVVFLESLRIYGNLSPAVEAKQRSPQHWPARSLFHFVALSIFLSVFIFLCQHCM